MAREDNLIPANKRTPEERKKLGAAGGRKSGEAKRRKKAMREQMEYLLSRPLDNPELAAQAKALGVDTSELDNQMGLMVATFLQALQGDTKATNIIRELVGERVTEIKVDTNINDKVEELQSILDEI